MAGLQTGTITASIALCLPSKDSLVQKSPSAVGSEGLSPFVDLICLSLAILLFVILIQQLRGWLGSLYSLTGTQKGKVAFWMVHRLKKHA